LIDEINKILSNYSCKIVASDIKSSAVSVKLKDIKIDNNQTLANIEKYLKSILKINIKIIGLIKPNIPSYKKLNELHEYQKELFNQTDLVKKLNTLSSLSIAPLNHDEDWIMNSMSNIYLKIATKEEKELFNQFLIKLKVNNTELYNKVYNLLLDKFPHIKNWLK